MRVRHGGTDALPDRLARRSDRRPRGGAGRPGRRTDRRDPFGRPGFPRGPWVRPVAGRPPRRPEAHGSVEQVYVFGAPVGPTSRFRRHRASVQRRRPTGSAANVPPGRAGNRLPGHGGRRRSSEPGSRPPDETAPPSPATALYTGQTCGPRPPAAAEASTATSPPATAPSERVDSMPGPVAGGPDHTLIEYSATTRRTRTPASPASRILAQLLGYAFVGVTSGARAARAGR